MLTLESERRLKNVLVAIGDGERSLESSRQALCRIVDFAPLSAHERLDRDCTGNLSSLEILNFLRDNGISHVLESEARDLIAFFDNNGSGRLSSTEFTQILLPCEDNYLRSVTQGRLSRRVGRFDRLPADIESALARVIEQEVELSRRLSSLKKDMEVQLDYSTLAAFNSIDRLSLGRIDTSNLDSFLRSQGHFAGQDELVAIIRRLDSSGDATVTYSELSEFLRPGFAPSSYVPLPRSYYVPPSSYRYLSYSSPYYYPYYSSYWRSLSAERAAADASASRMALDRSIALEKSMALDRSMALERSIAIDRSVALERSIAIDRSAELERSIRREKSVDLERSIRRERLHASPVRTSYASPLKSTYLSPVRSPYSYRAMYYPELTYYTPPRYYNRLYYV